MCWFLSHIIPCVSNNKKKQALHMLKFLIASWFPRCCWQKRNICLSILNVGAMPQSSPWTGKSTSLYSSSTKDGLGVYWIHLDVHPSIRPSVCRQGFRNFFENALGSIHFIPGIYPCGVSLLTLINFRVPSVKFGLLAAKYLAGNEVSGTFWKTPLAQFISYLVFTLMG